MLGIISFISFYGTPLFAVLLWRPLLHPSFVRPISSSLSRSTSLPIDYLDIFMSVSFTCTAHLVLFLSTFFLVFFLFFVCDMRHTFKCQLPAAANGFLLPARSAVPLFLWVLLSITRSFFFVLFSICHTHTTPPIPAIAAPFFLFLFETCVNYRRKEVLCGARRLEKGMWAAASGGTPRG